MIGRVSGVVISEEPDGSVVVDVGGVGLEVRAPLGTVGRVSLGSGGRVQLFTHLHVREDALDLYGFGSDLERRVFRMLLDVPNVGPKTALGVLSALPAAELARAVETKDIARLTRIDGVGKKTAERLVLELREKMAKLGPWTSGPALAASPTSSDDRGRIQGALMNMGYRPADAERAVSALGERLGKEPLADLLKEALRVLSG